jgi:hypothetical protein
MRKKEIEFQTHEWSFQFPFVPSSASPSFPIGRLKFNGKLETLLLLPHILFFTESFLLNFIKKKKETKPVPTSLLYYKGGGGKSFVSVEILSNKQPRSNESLAVVVDL